MSLLKNIYSEAFYTKFAETLAQVLPNFDRVDFQQRIFSSEFANLELKERVKHTAKVLNHFLPKAYPEAADLLVRIIQKIRETNTSEQSFAYMFLPEYVSMFGLEDFETSAKAMEYITQFISCEFAVRPFLLKYESQMLAQMLEWAEHPNEWVRRLASEGSRPRLPWGMMIPNLKNDPIRVLPILEKLKNDPSETVRRSVANSLNDISKTHPSLFLTTAKSWKGISEATDALLKHAARTLLKKADPAIFDYYQLTSASVKVENLLVHTPKVAIGQALDFEFRVENLAPAAQKIRLEYGIYYLKNNGQISKKVFKISERIFEPGQSLLVSRKQSFRLITTRKFYPGGHKISIIANGTEKLAQDFELIP